jgi:PAS domain S-box-containing protein
MQESNQRHLHGVRLRNVPPRAMIRRKALAGVLVALALNLLIGYVGWRTVLAGGEQSDWVAHTQAALIQLGVTLGHVVDAETGARGFALTGTEAFLEPYVSGGRARGQDVAMLRRLTADMPSQQGRLAALDGELRSAYEFDDEMVATRRRTQVILDPDTLETNKRRVDAVRTTIQEMQAGLEHLLEERIQANRSAQQKNRAITVVGTLLGFLFLTLAGFTIDREIRKNTTLHERVEQRTVDLQAENARGAQIRDQLRASEEMYRLMLDGIKDYAVYMLTPQGEVASWNTGAARIKGYETDEILGRHFAVFYKEADRRQNHPEKALEEAVRTGRHENRGWRLRKDGSEFWGESVITPMYDENGTLRGYSKVVCDITQRKHAEDRLHESQDQLAAVIQSAMDGVIAVDEQQRVILFNGTAERIFGYPAAEAIGKPLDHFLPQRFRSAHAEHVRGFARTGVTSRAMGTQGPLRGVRSNGEEFPIEASISQVEVDGKKLFTAIVRDVSERERAEAVLREQAQVLELAQVLVRDQNGSIVLWNLGAQELYGFTKEEALGRISHELLQTEFPEPLERIEEKLRSAGRWEGELAHCKRDGSRMVVSSVWVLHRDIEGRPARVLEANVDITARKQAEDELGRIENALRIQTRMLHSILDSMSEGLIAADENGKFLLWNPAAVNILGRGPADLPVGDWASHYAVYRTDGVTLFPTDELPLVRALHGHTVSVEMVVRNPKLKADVWIEATARPLKDERGLRCGGVVALRDITQRKVDEQEIRRLNDELEQKVIRRTAQLEAANKELEAFTYSVSHDLRAPLRHIAGFSGMLIEESGSALDARSMRLLQRIQEGTQRMGQMVDELLSLARVGRQALNLQVTGLNSIVDEVLGVLQQDYDGRLIEWRIARLPFVDCDATLIRLVFQNLISNALKYSRPRSPAVIEIGKTEENAIFIRDNGVGFSMKHADKLFGVFQRLHRAEDFEGTGVGLATAQRIIQKHGGRIWAEAELDRGATFYFTLAEADNSRLLEKEGELEHA